MPPPNSPAPDTSPPIGLAALAAQVRRDLERLNVPAANWVPPVIGPDGKPALDVLIIGGGMCGQTLAFALARDGVRNVRTIDRAARGHEGPWGTTARMETLRSPKHLTGPDLGVPSLTFRAWYEAQHGAGGWERLHKAATRDWLAYLLWVRDAAGIAVENGTEAVSITPGQDFVRVELTGRRGREIVHARKVVLAAGRDGSGGPYTPAFPSLGAGIPRHGRVFHSSDAIDFARWRGGRIGVLGASASAFDNAAVALETGAAGAHLFSRRPHLPQINKSKGMAYPGFFLGFRDLDDELRWRIYTYVFDVQTPPPHESVLRCDRQPGFKLHFSEPWLDVQPDCDGVTVITATARYRFDAVIFATGFVVDLALRPELAAVRDNILLWGDRVSREEAERNPHPARFPYLGPGFELIERSPGATPGLEHIHCFNWGVTFSHGALSGDIPGVAEGVERLSRALATRLFVAGAATLEPALRAHDDRELEPTRYFVPR